MIENFAKNGPFSPGSTMFYVLIKNRLFGLKIFYIILKVTKLPYANHLKFSKNDKRYIPHIVFNILIKNKESIVSSYLSNDKVHTKISMSRILYVRLTVYKFHRRFYGKRANSEFWPE